MATPVSMQASFGAGSLSPSSVKGRQVTRSDPGFSRPAARRAAMASMALTVNSRTNCNGGQSRALGSSVNEALATVIGRTDMGAAPVYAALRLLGGAMWAEALVAPAALALLGRVGRELSAHSSKKGERRRSN